MGSIYNFIAIILSNHNLLTCAHVNITPFKSKEVSNYVALTLTNDQLTKLVKRNPNACLKNSYSYIFQALLIGKLNILIIELKYAQFITNSKYFRSRSGSLGVVCRFILFMKT
jgi:hypothetical protein